MEKKEKILFAITGILIWWIYTSSVVIFGNLFMDMGDKLFNLEYQKLPLFRIASILISLIMPLILLLKSDFNKYLNWILITAIILFIISYFSGREFNLVIQFIPTMINSGDAKDWEMIIREERKEFDKLWMLTNYFEYCLLTVIGIIIYKLRLADANNI